MEKMVSYRLLRDHTSERGRKESQPNTATAKGKKKIPKMDTPPPLEKSLRILIDDLPPISSDACIYSVPEELRSLNDKAYTPQIVSIGAMHCGKAELQAMEEHKLRCLQAFLDRAETSLEDCIRVVKGLEERARNCYAGRIDLTTSNQFVSMLLVDSCLIIEIMLRSYFSDEEELTDSLSRRILTFGVRMDMVLLEYQIPFFVLDGIFNLGIFNYLVTRNFLNLSLLYFYKFGMTILEGMQTENVSRYLAVPGNEVKHVVDLLRIWHLPSTRLSSDNTSTVIIQMQLILRRQG